MMRVDCRNRKELDFCMYRGSSGVLYALYKHWMMLKQIDTKKEGYDKEDESIFENAVMRSLDSTVLCLLMEKETGIGVPD